MRSRLPVGAIHTIKEHFSIMKMPHVDSIISWLSLTVEEGRLLHIGHTWVAVQGNSKTIPDSLNKFACAWSAFSGEKNKEPPK